MRALERYLLLQIIDQRWREHLYDMDYLREGIHLRGFAQIEPLVAYKNEAFTLFADLMNSIWADFARMIYNVEVEVEGARTATRRRRCGPARRCSAAACGALRVLGRHVEDQPSAYGGEGYGVDADEPQRDAGRRSSAGSTSTSSIGRNDPCWCGSGKKFKKCHGA